MIDEINRLSNEENNPNVQYYAASIGLPDGLYGNDDGGGAKGPGGLANKLRTGDGCGIDSHLVGSSPQDGAYVIYAPKAAADGKGNKYLSGCSLSRGLRIVP